MDLERVGGSTGLVPASVHPFTVPRVAGRFAAESPPAEGPTGFRQSGDVAPMLRSLDLVVRRRHALDLNPSRLHRLGHLAFEVDLQ